MKALKVLFVGFLFFISCQEVEEKREQVKEVTSSLSRLDSLANSYLSKKEKNELKKVVSVDSLLKYKDEIVEISHLVKDKVGVSDSIKKHLSENSIDKEQAMGKLKDLLQGQDDLGLVLDSIKSRLQE